MQYPAKLILERLENRSARLRSRIPKARDRAEQEHAAQTDRYADKLAVAERRTDLLRDLLTTDAHVPWDEVADAAYKLYAAAGEAARAVSKAPDYSTAQSLEHDADEVEGIAELIKGAGATTVPTSELEKLGALRWVR